MENSISTHGNIHETTGKINEQCEWDILATKCSKWEILGAKNKEGSLDDQKKNCQKKIKNCQLNFAPERRKEGTKKEGMKEGGREERRKEKGKREKKTEYFFFDAFEQLDLP